MGLRPETEGLGKAQGTHVPGLCALSAEWAEKLPCGYSHPELE